MTLSLFAIVFAHATPSRAAELPPWAKSEWSKQDQTYRQILYDVQPYYNGIGFTDSEIVSKKVKYYFQDYKSNQSDSIKLMRALAWFEVALSDGNNFASEEMKRMKREFNVLLRLWTRPVNSFSFVRTFAIVEYIMTSPDTYVDSKLIEKLYAKDQSDVFLETVYLVWCSSNQSVSPNRLTLEKLLEKQLKITYRIGPRRQLIAMCYLLISTFETRSPRLLMRNIAVMQDYVNSLPEGHSNNTQEFRKRVSEGIEFKKRTAERWRREDK